MKLLFKMRSLVTTFHRFGISPSAIRGLSMTQAQYRKPKSLGRAPSKEGIYFEKPKPTQRDLERGEIAYKSYNELLRSIAAAFQEELLIKEESSNLNTVIYDEEAHHEKCMEYNDAYNKEMNRKRQPRLLEILKQQENVIKEKEVSYEQDLNLKLKKFEVEVTEALSEYEHWITLENLEEKIIESMNNIVNYNFSVNKMGKIQTRTLIP